MARSAEVIGLVAWLSARDVSFRVTDYATPGVHTPSSYHYRPGTGGTGLAIDVAGVVPGDRDAMLAIFEAFKPAQQFLAELIYSGAAYSIKNGRVVERYAVDAHWDHVHVAVERGVVLVKGPTNMPDDPALHNITGPVTFHPIFNSAGLCTGYYIFSTKTGEVHAYGTGAPYLGRSEVTA
jgi:hypothetical protein